MMGKSHDEYMIERFRANPAYAADLLNSIFEDGDDQGELRLILQHITAAGLRVSPVSVTPKAAAAGAEPASRAGLKKDFMPNTPEQGRNPAAAAPPGRAGGVVKIAHFRDKNGRDCFQEWASGLRDNKAKEAVDRRLLRVRSNNFGDCGPIRDGVWELRVDVGPGYRVYYAKDGLTVVLLLCGGDKHSQTRDIDRAVEYWREWQERKKLGQKKEGGA